MRDRSGRSPETPSRGRQPSPIRDTDLRPNPPRCGPNGGRARYPPSARTSTVYRRRKLPMQRCARKAPRGGGPTGSPPRSGPGRLSGTHGSHRGPSKEVCEAGSPLPRCARPRPPPSPHRGSRRNQRGPCAARPRLHPQDTDRAPSSTLHSPGRAVRIFPRASSGSARSRSSALSPAAVLWQIQRRTGTPLVHRHEWISRASWSWHDRTGCVECEVQEIALQDGIDPPRIERIFSITAQETLPQLKSRHDHSSSAIWYLGDGGNSEFQPAAREHGSRLAACNVELRNDLPAPSAVKHLKMLFSDVFPKRVRMVHGKNVRIVSAPVRIGPGFNGE